MSKSPQRTKDIELFKVELIWVGLLVAFLAVSGVWFFASGLFSQLYERPIGSTQESFKGDLNGDLVVNVFDLGMLAGCLGEQVVLGDSRLELCNLQANDAVVDVFDLGILVGLYGTVYDANIPPTNTPIPSPTPIPDATSTPTITPTPTRSDSSTSCRPYTDDSPWNTVIDTATVQYHPNSQLFTDVLVAAHNRDPLGSSPNSWTFPVYEVDNQTPLTRMRFSNVYSNVIDNGNTLDRRTGGGDLMLPIPPDATPADGNDAQFIVINTDTGDEWGFYEIRNNGDGTFNATNGYHYNTNWYGVPPSGFGSRGPGITYLGGLIRQCDLVDGVIDHALAFAYDDPCAPSRCATDGHPPFVFPATKTDGRGNRPFDIPEGARLHISPPPTDAEVNSWCGTDQTCRMMVVALTDYGMYVIDNAGSPKIYPEDTRTAHWGTVLTYTTPQKIPLGRFKVISF